jgi:hypothetical protein
MKEYARQRNLRRWILRVPFLSLSLSSRWLTLITPVYAAIGRCLIESVRNPSVVRNPAAQEGFSFDRWEPASDRACLGNEDQDAAQTRWSDARAAASLQRTAACAHDVLTHEQTIRVRATPAQAFAPIRRIGGRTGWYFGNKLWRIRGLIDLLMGGVGMRRGRPDAETPFPGSTLDFWRVQVYEPDCRLRLFAEMKVPGRAWLEFRVKPEGTSTIIQQIAQFEPRGLAGVLYWYLLSPIHEIMFRAMLRRIASAVLQPLIQS